MTDRDRNDDMNEALEKALDKTLDKAAQAPYQVDPALLDAVADSIKSSMRPVRPLPPARVLSVGVFLIAAAIAIAGAARAGFHGIEKLDPLQSAIIFSALAVLIWAAAQEFISQMIPGSRHRLDPRALMQTCTVALVIVFALLFRDYRTTHFLSAGALCLFTGVLHAIPAGVLSWWVLRRGFAVNLIAAGLAGGMVGGLAGLTMLELHCDNFQAMHIIVWHTAVVPFSGAVGALLAWAYRARSAANAEPPR